MLSSKLTTKFKNIKYNLQIDTRNRSAAQFGKYTLNIRLLFSLQIIELLMHTYPSHLQYLELLIYNISIQHKKD